MHAQNRLSKIFETAEQISFNDSSRIVLMSDCHRGDGSWADDLSRNQNLYLMALTYYNNEKYTYIEIGDGDELWENKKFSDITAIHFDALELLSKFFDDKRLYFIYGNHDIVKKNSKFVSSNMNSYYNERTKTDIPLFEGIKIHEALVLKYSPSNKKIFLLHGHQVDFLNNQLWRLSRFLVRYLWKPLESFGIKDPTSTSKNPKKKDTVEVKLTRWVRNEKHMLIAGHTHRPVFPEIGEPPYFNDGSCVSPRFITGIEIAFGRIMLVKWSIKTKLDGTLFVSREIIDGPTSLSEYFNNTWY